MAVVVGGIGALAWGMRKRVRIAIGRGDPDFHIIEPIPEETAAEMSAGEEQDPDAEPSPDPDRDQSGPGAQDEPR